MTDINSLLMKSDRFALSFLISSKNGHLTASSPTSISQSLIFKELIAFIIGYVSSSLSSLLSDCRANLCAYIIETGDSFTNDLPYIIMLIPLL